MIVSELMTALRGMKADSQVFIGWSAGEGGVRYRKAVEVNGATAGECSLIGLAREPKADAVPVAKSAKAIKAAPAAKPLTVRQQRAGVTAAFASSPSKVARESKGAAVKAGVKKVGPKPTLRMVEGVGTVLDASTIPARRTRRVVSAPVVVSRRRK